MADVGLFINELDEADGVDRVVYHYDGVGILRLRKLHQLAPWGTGVQFRVHCPDVQTAVRGIITRIFFHYEFRGGEKVLVRPFRPARADVGRILNRSRASLLRHTGYAAPLTRQQFLAPLGGSKLARYTAAADSVEASPVVAKDAYLQTFVKAEKLNVSAKADPDPRVIQPRNPRYNYAVGLYIKGCEHMIYKAINKMFGQVTVMKGLNADQRGQAFADAWLGYDEPAGVGLDASRFDQHVSRALLEFEHSVYNSIYHDAELRRLLRMQLVNRGFVRSKDGSVKYTVEGSRMSGDMNTSLGNVLLMCLMVHAYLADKPFKASLLNDGDDCVLICERAHLAQLADLPDWFQQLGMIMQVEEPVFVLEDVEFCQSHPIEIRPGVWRMVRDPRVVLSKDLCVVQPVNDLATWTRMRHAISECGLALAGDVPVFNEFYNSLGRGCSPSKRALARLAAQGPQTGMEFLALGMHRKYQVPTSTCRVSFAKAFGIWPDLQVALEQEYRGLTVDWHDPECVDQLPTFYQLC
jgi:hypothetical protein